MDIFVYKSGLGRMKIKRGTYYDANGHEPFPIPRIGESVDYVYDLFIGFKKLPLVNVPKYELRHVKGTVRDVHYISSDEGYISVEIGLK